MVDEKTRPSRQSKPSTKDPVEGKRDVPANDSQLNKRKYDVDKVDYQDSSSEDPTEEIPTTRQGKRR